MKIHALYQGSPLCGFSDKFPKDWPRNNKWTSFKSENEITCSLCKEKAKALNQKESNGEKPATLGEHLNLSRSNPPEEKAR